MRRVLDDLKYQSEYGFILLMGISKTSDFARFFELKGMAFQYKSLILKAYSEVRYFRVQRGIRRRQLRVRLYAYLPK